MRTMYARCPPLAKNAETAYGNSPGPSKPPNDCRYACQLSTATGTLRLIVCPGLQGVGAHSSSRYASRAGPRGATPTNAHTSIPIPYLPEQAAKHPGEPSMSVHTVLNALELTIAIALHTEQDLR